MADKKTEKPTITNGDPEEVVIIPDKPETQAPQQSEPASVPGEVAVLPVRNMVLFPGTVVPLALAREKSRRLVSSVLPSQKIIACVCQKNQDTEEPDPEDLYDVGCAVTILKLMKLEDDQQGVIVHGLSRIAIKEWLSTDPYFAAKIEVLEDQDSASKRARALEVTTRDVASRVIDLAPNIPEEAHMLLENLEDPGALADFLASNLQMDIGRRQEFLEELSVQQRLVGINEELQKQLEILELSSKIQSQVKQKIDRTQREYYLQEQLKAIQKELGEQDEQSAEIEELREQIEASGMPDSVLQEARRQLGRLEKIPVASPDHNVTRTYLEVLSELPWSTSSEDRLDVNLARKVLDEDHYDLDKVKRRILEYLAVRKLAPESRGPILCFVGPPGVGKTSLGRSIARALGRKFIRMSLGGMRDEAELRGHRRTYIGAMPGRIVQELRKAGTNNPVFMLDELDKVGQDFRGDPTSALLEVLDPAQNSSFQDHYLNVPFDLSKVVFIGTANYMAPVPPALRDRMEVIELPGYTQTEKLHIAKRYLVGRQVEENGLTPSKIKFNDKALKIVIDRYTREAGVRELERQIGTLCRGVAAMIAEGKAKSRTINEKLVEQLLGPAKYESELAMRSPVPGVATGLAYTPVGGEIIFVEATRYPGKGGLLLTGQIGDVMKESAQTALSLVKSRADSLGLNGDGFGSSDLHIHVPAGAVPKDGPSAGTAMFTALASLFMDTPALTDVAMTGEVTLRGVVLPIGGVKEKVLAARRAGIRRVILPERNRKDLVDVPEEVQKKLEFRFVRTVDDVLEVALKGRARRTRGKTTSRRKGGRGRKK
jgi:ATP-dependent Lon protease